MEATISPRVKKFIGAFVMVVFVIAYALAIMGLAPRVLNGAAKATELAFYGLAGLAWIIPLMPLIRWMERR